MAKQRACDSCHKRKIQCDFEKGQARCDWCAHQGLACTFQRPRGRKKPGRALATRISVTRVRDEQKGLPEPVVEEHRETYTLSMSEPAPHRKLFHCTEPCNTPRSQSPLSRVPASYSQISYDGCYFGYLSHQNGMPMLSSAGKRWIASRTGEDVSFHKFESAPNRHTVPLHLPIPRHHQEYQDELYQLPDRSLVEDLFDMFIHSAFSMVFPVMDKTLFPDILNKAYQSMEPISTADASAKACILAFTTIICLVKEEDFGFPRQDVENHALKVRYLLSSSSEEASLTTLQATFLLVFYEACSGRLQSAAIFHSAACSLVFRLGGHVHLPPKSCISKKDHEWRQLRNLFWLSYIFDKDLSLRAGTPPLMSDDYCDLTLPDGYVECYAYLPHLDESVRLRDSETLSPHFVEDPRLSILKEKVGRRLYSAQTLKKTNAELLRDIRELDEELETWRVSIPALFRPALSISHGTQVDEESMTLPRSMRHITLHLGYHHLMSAIHRASARCMSGSEASDAEEWLPGVQSSIALALEASRSTLIYLRAAIRGVADKAFWIMVYYPTTAMMTLFLNILSDPLNPRVEEDVRLLASTADLIHGLAIQSMTSPVLAHIKLMTDFIAELTYLSHKAIAKARAESEQRQNLKA